MRDLIVRFLQSSHTDPVYFITGIVDVMALLLSRRLKRGLSNLDRALSIAVIIVAVVLTAAVACKFFGYIKDWKELETLWNSQGTSQVDSTSTAQ